MSETLVPRIRIGEIYQIAIVVRDLQESMERYWKTLGIGPWRIHRFAPPALSETTVRGKRVDYSMMIAFARSGPLEVELIEPLEGPSIYKEFLANKGEGLHHIQSRVENPEATLDAFKEMGIEVLMSGRIAGSEFFYMDTEPVLGIIYEFSRRPALPLEGIYPPP